MPMSPRVWSAWPWLSTMVCSSFGLTSNTSMLWMSPVLLRPASKSKDSEVLPQVTVTNAANPCSAIRLSRVRASGDLGRRLTLLLSGKSMSIVLSRMVRISTLSTSLSGIVDMYFPLHLNQTTGDSYTTVTSCAASTRRSSVGLIVRSLVNQAFRGLQSPLFAEPGALAPGGDSMTQFFKQHLRLLQVFCVKPLSEPVVNFREHLPGFFFSALLLPQPAQTHCCTQLQRLCPLPPRYLNGFEKTRLRRRQGEWKSGGMGDFFFSLSPRLPLTHSER